MKALAFPRSQWGVICSQTMSDYMNKVLGGEIPTAEDWRKHLIEAHAKAPSMSPAAFADCRNTQGLNSYEWLALSTKSIPTPNRIVDLACGDGFLIPILQSRLPNSTTFLGIDMSATELELAKGLGLARTSFQCSTADATGIESESADAIFCHMAFMLMLPVEPVVAEVHRILRTGGMFAGVVGDRGKESGLFSKIQAAVGQFLGQRFSRMSKPVTGDPRAQTETGLRKLLDVFKDVQIVDEKFEASLDPDGVWEHIKNMYIIGALPRDVQSELRNTLNDLFEKELHTKGSLVLDFPMQKFVAVK